MTLSLDRGRDLGTNHSTALPRIITAAKELDPGQRIQASINGIVHVQGIVQEVHPVLDVFWAFTTLGERRLLDLDSYTVVVLD